MSKTRYIIVFIGLNILIFPCCEFAGIVFDLSVVGNDVVTFDTIERYLVMSITNSLLISTLAIWTIRRMRKLAQKEKNNTETDKIIK